MRDAHRGPARGGLRRALPALGGVHGSDLPALNSWASIKDPYGSGEDVWVIPPITPDFAVIHANEVNELGDARIYGTFNWDRIMTRAAKQVFVVAEQSPRACRSASSPSSRSSRASCRGGPIVPNGAWPGSCWPYYEIDYPAVEAYMDTPARSSPCARPESEVAHA